jgi:Protein of unknown function (DUF3768)
MTTEKIANQNDFLRMTFLNGEILITSGISALPENVQAEILTAVRTFDAFTPDNNPYGERDFGAFDHPEAGKVFWKIDYYDPTMTKGSEDPSDPTQTRRVLTILLASEY